jgi:glycosyltransferase involved in cell wall biosynthesis
MGGFPVLLFFMSSSAAVNTSLAPTEVEDLLFEVWADLGKLDSGGSPLRFHAPNLLPASVNPGGEEPGTACMIDRLRKLRSIYPELQQRAHSIGNAPPSPDSLRARIGAILIRTFSRMFWWQTWSLNRYAESVNAVLFEHLVILEAIENNVNRELDSLRVQLREVSRKLHQAQTERYKLAAAYDANRIENSRLREQIQQIAGVSRSAAQDQGAIVQSPSTTRGAEASPPVTIIVLTGNSLHSTARRLQNLRDFMDSGWHRVIVIDGGTTDRATSYLSSLPWVELIQNEFPAGPAACNLAIRAADATSDVILLSADAEIRDPQWIHKLRRTAYSSDDVGIAGCRLIRPDGLLLSAGVYRPPDTFRAEGYGAGEKDINQYVRDRDVESVRFACLYLKRATMAAIGLLDEEYVDDFAAEDYCLRAGQRALRTVCCGGLTVVQHEDTASATNSLQSSDIFGRAETAFRRKWEQQLRQTRYTRQIGWHSIFNFPTGYATSSRQLASALDRAGVHVAYRYVYGPSTLFPKPEPETSDSQLVNVIRQRPLTPDRVQVVYGQGDVFESNFGAYKIGFTMLETDRIPSEWVRQANLMDEVWVPSTFNRQTLLESGVNRPVHVVPLGVDPNYFHPNIASHPWPDGYTFLSVFEWVERKAPELLLKAFNDEFRANEPVVLFIKTMNVDPSVDVRRDVADLELKEDGGRIHLALNHEVPSYQLGSLYRSADCLVMASHGEGWGMPVIEAMACGLPVIATNWSAHCDYMTEGNAYPLRIEGLVPAKARCGYYAGFNWAEPSYIHLRSLMRHVFQNQAEARAKGARASREILESWTWEHSARKIIRRLDAIAEERKDRGKC